MLVKSIQKTILSGAHVIWGGGFYLAVRTAIWGAVALYPPRMFESSSVYEVYARYADENVWGFAALVTGVVLLASMMTKNMSVVFISALFMFMFYLFGVVCYSQAITTSGAGYTWGFNALWSLLLMAISAVAAPSLLKSSGHGHTDGG